MKNNTVLEGKEEKDMGAVEVKRIMNLVPELLEAPYSRIRTAYDKEADVLYINFKKPSHADGGHNRSFFTLYGLTSD